MTETSANKHGQAPVPSVAIGALSKCGHCVDRTTLSLGLIKAIPNHLVDSDH
jgi:hypothetical protein